MHYAGGGPPPFDLLWTMRQIALAVAWPLKLLRIALVAAPHAQQPEHNTCLRDGRAVRAAPDARTHAW